MKTDREQQDSSVRVKFPASPEGLSRTARHAICSLEVVIERILVGLDGSPQSERAMSWVVRLFPEAELTLVQVIELAYTMDEAPRVLVREREERSKQYLSGLSAKFTPPVRFETRLGSAAPVLMEAACEFHSDLIAVTIHSTSVRLCGGTTEKLIQTAPLPVLVVPPSHPPEQIRRLLVPLDGSELSASVLPLAETIAQRHQAEALLFHVLQGPAEPMEMQLSQQCVTMNRLGIRARWRLVGGTPHEEIIRAQKEEKSDLLVMSAHGYGGFKRLVLGSVAGRVLRECPAPVLVARSETLEKTIPTALDKLKMK